MKKHNINHYSTYGAMKASRVTEYNKSKHRTTGMALMKVNRKNANQLLATVYSNVKQVKPAKYQVGDFVRVSKYKTIFAKRYTPNWSTEIFRIQKVQNTNPRTHLLIDQQSNPIQEGLYEQELHYVKYPEIYLVERVLKRK
ncbi:uncharacterized protein LOC124404727 [Diprion similis]|uniref:uncharacterized protein LOC124404727 n=1 Tax=Diprion similis TaxID=362088 RepID=UPI001EF998B2|nr:uncharacterized protein LOC124404727 [Diprion similis]